MTEKTFSWQLKLSAVLMSFTMNLLLGWKQSTPLDKYWSCHGDFCTLPFYVHVWGPVITDVASVLIVDCKLPVWMFVSRQAHQENVDMLQPPHERHMTAQ